MIKKLENVYELIPKGSSDDKTHMYELVLPDNVVLIKRLLSGNITNLQQLAKGEIDYSTVHKLNYHGLQVVDFHNISDKIITPKFSKGDSIICRRHFEFTMVPTLYRDDITILMDKVKGMKPDVFKMYYIAMYGLINPVDIYAVSKIDDNPLNWIDFYNRQ